MLIFCYWWQLFILTVRRRLQSSLLRSVFTCSMILFGLEAAHAEPYVEPATGLIFPDRIEIGKNTAAYLERGDIKAFDDARYGISIKYYFVTGDTMQATIFIYDGGIPGIANGLESNFAKASCGGLADVGPLIAAGYKDIKFDETDGAGMGNQIGSMATCFVSFTFVGAMDRMRNSFSYLTGYNGKIVKIRVSNLIEHALISDVARLSLLQMIGDQMRPR